MEPKFPSAIEDKKVETPSFPEEMYAVSGFLPPNSAHYEKSRRFDENIKKAAAEQHIPNSFRRQFKVRIAHRPREQKVYENSFYNEALKLPLEERLEILRNQEKLKLLIAPPLYSQDTTEEKNNFFRASFAKTGSETTLLGGSLRHKLIIRHIAPEAFLAWQKAYEAAEEWKKYGFDYVPIEPIQSYRLNKKGVVDVASGVLDINLAQWQTLFDYDFKFKEELEELRERIEYALENIGVFHMHAHHENFALRFFRKEDGDIDIDRVPRIYMIDFDKAEIRE